MNFIGLYIYIYIIIYKKCWNICDNMVGHSFKATRKTFKEEAHAKSEFLNMVLDHREAKP